MHGTETNKYDFLSELGEKGIRIDSDVLNEFDLEKVERYYHFLRDNNERGGFFSRGDTERILERHLLESFYFSYYVARALNVSRETRIADAGTGPGLPGFLFACMKTIPRLTLIDSSRRRLSLLESFAETQFSESRRPKFLYERLEDCRDQYDVIVIRALIPFPFCLELISRMQKSKGHAVYFGSGRELEDSPSTKSEPGSKGGDWQDHYLKNLGYVSRETIQPDELQFLGPRRINLLLKSGPTKKGYPRPWKTIRDEMRDKIGLA